MCYGFLKIWIWEKLFRKEKNGHFMKTFEIFKILKIRHSSFVALLILRHFFSFFFSFDTRCGIVARRGMASFKAKFPVLQELFAKNHRGSFGPPAGARVR